jgi:hypothetical protein
MKALGHCKLDMKIPEWEGLIEATFLYIDVVVFVVVLAMI